VALVSQAQIGAAVLRYRVRGLNRKCRICLFGEDRNPASAVASRILYHTKIINWFGLATSVGEAPASRKEKRDELQDYQQGPVIGDDLTLSLASARQSDACTRAVYQGPDGTIVTGRSMDWAEETGTDLWAFPRGMKRDGAAGPTSVKWISKYGSVICSFYGVSSVDGMNEQGLVANVLYLTESEYPKPDGRRPTMSIAAWAQYVLDNYASVTEAVNALRDDPFVIIAPDLPGGMRAAGHLALSDPTGDSAIFEYVKGKLVIHHAKSIQS